MKNEIEFTKKERKIVAETTRYHITPEQMEFALSLPHDELITSGGAGKKCLDVITGESDYMVYLG